jgi:hypothetical protein
MIPLVLVGWTASNEEVINVSPTSKKDKNVFDDFMGSTPVTDHDK